MSDWNKLTPIESYSIGRWKKLTPVADAVVASTVSFPIPAFNKACVWNVSSDLQIQYNYTSSRAFTITQLPLPSVNVDFCPCIRWRVGSVVTRLKLWENVGEYLHVPLYNGEIVLPNFCIEIWNVIQHPHVSFGGGLISTSIKSSGVMGYNAFDRTDLDFATGVPPFVVPAASQHLTN